MVHHQGIAQVVDVLRSTRKVQVFLQMVKLLILAAKFLFQEILNSFYVMVCGLFDILDSLAILFVEILKDGVKVRVLRLNEPNSLSVLRHNLFGKEPLVPLQLNKHTIPHQRKLTEVWSKLCNLFCISAVNGRYRSKCGRKGPSLYFCKHI